MTLDHIVLAVPDLAAGAARFHERTGVRPAAGGSHTGLGTANHLVGLGNGGYLEIIGPDPDQPDPDRPRPFGIDALTAERVVTWCVRPADFDATVATAVARGYDPGPPRAMSRLTPAGTLLSWRLTPGAGDSGDGLVPFLIDWGTSTHPASTGLPELALDGMHAEHPDPDRIRAGLAALDLDLPVRPGPEPRLVVTLRGPLGVTRLT
jgi:hypothetical protein